MAKKRAQVKYPKSQKFDPSQNLNFLDATPAVAPQPVKVNEVVAKKVKKAKNKKRGEDPESYGLGLIELMGHDGKYRYNWMDVYLELSENKQLGVQAHAAWCNIFPECRRSLDRSNPTYLEDYIKLCHEKIDEWKVKWGHIPGWWNSDLPRKVAS